MIDPSKAESTNRARSGAGTVIGLGTILAILIPLLSFFVCALINGLDAASAFTALREQSAQHRHNPLLTAIPALLPLYLFAGLLWLYSRRRRINHPGALAGIGVAAASAVQLWVNWTFWNVFLPDRVYPGFPHGLEFVIGPLFFAPVAMAFCLLAASLALRQR